MNVESSLDNCKITGNYILKSKLGAGASSLSSVWKSEHRVTGEEVAVKQVFVSKLNRHLKNCLECEINFLSSVNNPNIIRLLDVFQAEDSIFLVFEYCKGGSLAAYIQNHGRVHEGIARRLMQQLGAGLKILHCHHIVHRDLKPENILLSTQEADMVLKIADFGLSRVVQPGKYAETVCGSPLYMAPEVLQFQGLTCGVLVQSFLSFLMVPHLFMVGLMFSCYRTSTHVQAFHFLHSFSQR
ncbi:serine/threonine-protein kinase ATG1t isoform X5 [Mercurialis annua]|uniref:serine/threonine-protein kinase ATG1t isoform X5 n=1 Tax=Mercurialis annua TaxID=3986 RepID=UPI00215FDFF1|nr:serine/threonine-protein kinase ATG1t isoform X5 [Mercurialis annua]